MDKRMQYGLEIDLVELFYYLRKRLWIIALATALCALAALSYTKVFVDTEYTAQTRIYVLNRSNENFVSYADFQISNVLLDDYVVLITGQNVTQEVIRELGLNISHAKLVSMINVTAPNDTRVLQISVTDTDPQRAADIANCVREIASIQIKEIMDVDAVNLVYEAEVPQGRSGPNVKRNVVIAAAAGLIISMGVLAVIQMQDDTIKTEEDVEHYLGLSVLGVIPLSEEMAAAAKTTTTGTKQGKKSSGASSKAKK